MKVLVVEDDLTSRIMLEAVLGRWGYEVTGARDGEEAWDILQGPNAPRLVIVDWMMPGMDGLTLCRQLRSLDKEEPFYILLLTSKAEQRDIVQGLEAGADDYITKPFDSGELRARIGVGKRIVELMSELARRQRQQGVLEMAGAVCHELNQPLHIVSGYCEMLLEDLDETDPQTEALRIIREQVGRIGELTHKIMHITEYRGKDYLGGLSTIVNIHEDPSAASGMEDEKGRDEGGRE